MIVSLGPFYADRYAVLIFGHGRSTCPEPQLWHQMTISLTKASAWHEPYFASMMDSYDSRLQEWSASAFAVLENGWTWVALELADQVG